MTDHPLIENALRHSDDPNRNAENVRDDTVSYFVGLQPETRIQVLDYLDGVMQADDGASVKQRAQLLTLKRALNDTHYSLRRVGR